MKYAGIPRHTMQTDIHTNNTYRQTYIQYNSYVHVETNGASHWKDYLVYIDSAQAVTISHFSSAFGLSEDHTIEAISRL